MLWPPSFPPSAMHHRLLQRFHLLTAPTQSLMSSPASHPSHSQLIWWNQPSCCRTWRTRLSRVFRLLDLLLMLEFSRGFCLHVSCLCLLLFLLSQPTWKPLPLFVHSSTEGKLISTVWGQTDKQTQPRRCDRTGTSLTPGQPLPPSSLLPYLPLTAINSPQASQCKEETWFCIFSPSDLTPSSLNSSPVLSNWPVAALGQWWSLGAKPHQAKPEQNGLRAIRIFKINVMDIFSEENVSFACLSCMYIYFGNYISPPKEPDLITNVSALHHDDNVKWM